VYLTAFIGVGVNKTLNFFVSELFHLKFLNSRDLLFVITPTAA